MIRKIIRTIIQIVKLRNQNSSLLYQRQISERLTQQVSSLKTHTSELITRINNNKAEMFKYKCMADNARADKNYQLVSANMQFYHKLNTINKQYNSLLHRAHNLIALISELSNRADLWQSLPSSYNNKFIYQKFDFIKPQDDQADEALAAFSSNAIAKEAKAIERLINIFDSYIKKMDWESGVTENKNSGLIRRLNKQLRPFADDEQIINATTSFLDS